jgi:hypothetical protein
MNSAKNCALRVGREHPNLAKRPREGTTIRES